jgi:hypothetical protein
MDSNNGSNAANGARKSSPNEELLRLIRDKVRKFV